jgi:hypothetical protein
MGQYVTLQWRKQILTGPRPGSSDRRARSFVNPEGQILLLFARILVIVVFGVLMFALRRYMTR